eukprot:snap_masked-scaffold_1-processed-gene-4.26-mRNA-1 protein AED:1.00 eAED:1.00 QI:0/-1/0/0/-1/1/1/0/62
MFAYFYFELRFEGVTKWSMQFTEYNVNLESVFLNTEAVTKLTLFWETAYFGIQLKLGLDLIY